MKFKQLTYYLDDLVAGNRPELVCSLAYRQTVHCTAPLVLVAFASAAQGGCRNPWYLGGGNEASKYQCLNTFIWVAVLE